MSSMQQHSDVVSSPQCSTYQSCRTSVRDFLTVKKCQQTNKWEAGLRGSSYFVPIMYNQFSDDVNNCKRCKYFKLKRVVRLVLLYTLERSYSFIAGYLEPKYPKTYCTIPNIGVLHPQINKIRQHWQCFDRLYLQCRARRRSCTHRRQCCLSGCTKPGTWCHSVQFGLRTGSGFPCHRPIKDKVIESARVDQQKEKVFSKPLAVFQAKVNAPMHTCADSVVILKKTRSSSACEALIY